MMGDRYMGEPSL